MAEQKYETLKINALNTWGEKGNITFEINPSNGYCKLTHFPKETGARVIGVSMELKTVGILAKLIKRLANSKEELKYTIDQTTKPKDGEDYINGVIALAKRNNDVYIAIKKDYESPANATKIDIPLYHTLAINDEGPSKELFSKLLALSYADLLEGLVNNFKRESNHSNTEEEPYTEISNIDALTTWGDKGYVVGSIKNGHPRLTYFFKDNNGKDRKFITAAMDIKTFGVVGYIFKLLSNTKLDTKYTLECFTRDLETKNKILACVLIISRVNNEIFINIKKEHNSSDNLVKLEPSRLNKIKENNEDITKSFYIDNLALVYSNIIRNSILIYKPSKFNVPNSKRKEQSNKPAEYGDTDL